MTLVLSQPEVRRLLPMATCIELVERALVAQARGRGQNPLRRGVRTADGSGRLLGLMPGELFDPPALGVKVVTVTPSNHGTELDAHQGVVMLFSPENGLPLALFDASEITALRTAAASAVATRALARPDAGVLALIGSGVQARTHLAALREVRTLREVRVYSRSAAARAAFARRESERHGLAVHATATAEEAVRGADLVCTVTSSREPVLAGDWLQPGCHVNAAGACMPAARELDSRAVVRARLFTDCLESAQREAGDFLVPLAQGEITAAHLLGEVGAVVAGTLPGRTGDADITVFESLGIALEDLIVAEYLLRSAEAAGLGTRVELGGRVDAPVEPAGEPSGH